MQIYSFHLLQSRRQRPRLRFARDSCVTIALTLVSLPGVSSYHGRTGAGDDQKRRRPRSNFTLPLLFFCFCVCLFFCCLKMLCNRCRSRGDNEEGRRRVNNRPASSEGRTSATGAQGERAVGPSHAWGTSTNTTIRRANHPVNRRVADSQRPRVGPARPVAPGMAGLATISGDVGSFCVNDIRMYGVNAYFGTLAPALRFSEFNTGARNVDQDPIYPHRPHGVTDYDYAFPPPPPSYDEAMAAPPIVSERQPRDGAANFEHDAAPIVPNAFEDIDGNVATNGASIANNAMPLISENNDVISDPSDILISNRIVTGHNRVPRENAKETVVNLETLVNSPANVDPVEGRVDGAIGTTQAIVRVFVTDESGATLDASCDEAGRTARQNAD